MVGILATATTTANISGAFTDYITASTTVAMGLDFAGN